MSVAATDTPDDPRVVLVEVGAHLREISDRRISDPLLLAQAWSEVHVCDDAMLRSLDPSGQQAYRTVIDVPPARRRRQRAAGQPIIEDRVTRLRLAVSRRLAVLDDLVAA